MVEWIKEVIKKEDHTKVNRENLEKLIETSSYYWSGGTLKLQPWSYRWVVKKLKKNPHWTLKDIKQSLAPSEQAQRPNSGYFIGGNPVGGVADRSAQPGSRSRCRIG